MQELPGFDAIFKVLAAAGHKSTLHPANRRPSPRLAIFNHCALGAIPAADLKGTEHRTPSSSNRPIVQHLLRLPNLSTLLSGFQFLGQAWPGSFSWT